MEGNKTGALLACAVSIGAVLGGADDRTADTLEEYGYHLGLAFQAVDDLLGIWGDPVSTGKQTWSDLRQRKKSLPVVAALAAGGPASERLGEILAADAKSSDFENFSEEEFAARAALIEEAGGREWTAAGGPPSAHRRHRGPGRRRHARPGAGRSSRRSPTSSSYERDDHYRSNSPRVVAGRCREAATGTGRRRTHSSSSTLHTARRGSHDSDDRRKHRGPAAPRCRGQRNTDTDTPVAAGVPRSRRSAPRSAPPSTCSPGRTPRAGGRATSRPTSRWTPRTCCSVSSSASATRRPPQAAALFIRGEQREDGTWATFYGGPGELSATIEAYVALRLAGDAPDAPHMARASAWIRDAGRHRRRPGLHPDLAGPVRLVEVGGPARTAAGAHLLPQVVAAQHLRLRLLGPADHRAADRSSPRSARSGPRPSPLDELHTDPRRPEPAASPWPRWPAGTAPSSGSTRRLHALPQGRPAPAAQGRDEQPRARWIIERQENDGCWGGIQPPAVYSVIALHLLGYDLEHPVMRAGLESLDRFAVWREDGARMIEACQSPVWDTCLATIALADAGLPADHPQLVKAADWMLGEEIVRPGDWAVRGPQLAAGRLGVRVPQRQLPRHRRHRRGRPRAAPGQAPRPGAGGDGHRARGALEPRHAVEERRLGRLRRRQHQPVPQPAAVLRLRRGHRPAVRRRHRARRGDARRRGHAPTTRAPGAASSGCSPNRSRTARGSAAGASTTSTAPGRWCPR